MRMVIALLRKLFYNPRRHAGRLAFIELGKGAVLTRGARFEFQTGSKGFLGRIRIGDQAIVGCEFVFEGDQGSISIGNRTFINSGTRLISRESIQIGSNVTIAWGCTIYDHNSHSLDWRDRARDHERLVENVASGRPLIHGKEWRTVKSRPIVIEDKVWLGFDVIILGGVCIGEGAIVAAGSVVRNDVPAWTLVAGNPATWVKDLRRE
ncbi:MAG: hypothetical protein A3E01_08890 [Gammaproteobacteria bacterium RIFCSPHIGHO2_12_FULL_63_22]|nr:MAG: hypothetical protein A3E01_08890 [Gammaproteobacteria bacterium RIFCSPHIGHO2_12_FULL_63_22]